MSTKQSTVLKNHKDGEKKYSIISDDSNIFLIQHYW